MNIFALVALTVATFSPINDANGIVPVGLPCACVDLCAQLDCDFTEEVIENFHAVGEYLILEKIPPQFNDLRDFITDEFFDDYVLEALMMFTEQMSAVAMQQAMIVGTFFDAKHHLETERLFQELQFEAARDYQPSEDFCWIGTGARSLAASERRSSFNAAAMSARQLGRHLGNEHLSGAETRDQDKRARWDLFKSRYCDKNDNDAGENDELASICSTPDRNKTANLDIDYTRLIDAPRSINVAFDKAGLSGGDEEPDERDVLALGNNLYGHNVLTRNVNPAYLQFEESQNLYLALRSVAAKRSVAENSFNAIVGLKAFGNDEKEDDEDTASRTREFLGAILVELGMKEEEVFRYMGEHPSYYAQLEILAKKIYQDPDFYASLQEKPTNVIRRGAALKAIELMLDRAMYESQLRREMMASVLLSSRLEQSLGGQGENNGN